MSSMAPIAPRATALPGPVQRPDPSVNERMMAETALTVARIAASLIVPVLSFIFLPLPIALAITAVVIIANVADCFSRHVPSNGAGSTAPMPPRHVTPVNISTSPSVVEVHHHYPYGAATETRRRVAFSTGLAGLASSVGLRSFLPSATSRGALPLSGRDGPHVAPGSGHVPPFRPLDLVDPSLKAARSAGVRPVAASHVGVGSGHLVTALPPPLTRQAPFQPFSPSFAAFRQGLIRPEANPSRSLPREESAGLDSPQTTSPVRAARPEDLLIASAADPSGAPVVHGSHTAVGSRRGTG